LTPQADELEVYVQHGDELLLTGAALAALMRDVLAHGKPFRFRAKGVSMSPFIKDGDVLIVSPLPAGASRVGDVVAFLRADKRVVVHRVVSASPSGYVMRGDGVPAEDERVPPSSLLGAVTHVERNGRPVRLGAPLARRMIAALSRSGVLNGFLRPLWVHVKALTRRLQ
jgi:signal peptidase I